MNIVYPFVDNPISIYTPGYRSDSFTVKTSFGKIKDMDDGKYIFTCDSYTDNNIFFFVYMGTKVVSEFSIRIKPLPPPVFLFNRKEKPVVTITNSKDSTMAISTSFPNFDFNLKAYIKSFDFVIIQNGVESQIGVYTGNDSIPMSSVKINLRSCQKGDILYIKNLKYYYDYSTGVYTDETLKKDFVLLIE